MKSAHLANIITCTRIICSIALLFCPVLSVAFYILYIIAGVSDMIDGTIARKTGASGEFGSKLDTIADLIFVVICMIKLLPVIEISIWIFIWIGIITIIKVINIVSGFIAQRRFVTVHSVMNKITGGLIFAIPLTVGFIDVRYSVAAGCAAATFAAIQEGHYIRTGRQEIVR